MKFDKQVRTQKLNRLAFQTVEFFIYYSSVWGRLCIIKFSKGFTILIIWHVPFIPPTFQSITMEKL